MMMAALRLEPTLAGTGQPYGNWSQGKVTVKVTKGGGRICDIIVGCVASVFCKTNNFVRIN
jgi:hypothetical protein